MADISVYGYDPSMLWSVNNDGPRVVPSSSIIKITPTYRAAAPNGTMLLLKLPLELRQQIFRLTLPFTSYHPTKHAVWNRATTAILATNRQIYYECLNILYGENTFLVRVDSKGIQFINQWHVQDSGLIARSNQLWKQSVCSRQSDIIRRWIIELWSIDDYEGMVFHGKSNIEALALQVQGHIRTLCAMIKDGPEGNKITVVIRGHRRGTGEPKWREYILQPLVKLRDEGMTDLQCEENESWLFCPPESRSHNGCHR